MSKKMFFQMLAVFALASMLVSACTGQVITVEQTVSIEAPEAPAAAAPATIDYGQGDNPTGGAASELIPSPVSENVIPFAQAETCPSWNAGETKALKPGQTIMGDVTYVNDSGVKTPLYKSDTGGYEAARNTSSVDLMFFAEWGAGCLATTDEATIVNGELHNPNHVDFVYANLFTFTGNDKYTNKPYYSKDLPIK